MRRGAALVLALAAICTVLSAATGVAYASSDSLSSPPLGAWLATLAFLGAAALVAVGSWQRHATGRTRTLSLWLATGLAGAYVAANGFALLAGASGLPGTPRPLHWAGLGTGSALYVACLLESWLAVAGERRSRQAAASVG